MVSLFCFSTLSNLYLNTLYLTCLLLRLAGIPECTRNGWSANWVPPAPLSCSPSPPSPAKGPCPEWCKTNPVRWCDKCMWKPCEPCPTCASLTVNPPMWRNALTRRRWSEKVLDPNDPLQEVLEPNFFIHVWPTNSDGSPPLQGAHVPVGLTLSLLITLMVLSWVQIVNAMNAAFKDAWKAKYVSLGIPASYWPPFRTANMVKSSYCYLFYIMMLFLYYSHRLQSVLQQSNLQLVSVQRGQDVEEAYRVQRYHGKNLQTCAEIFALVGAAMASVQTGQTVRSHLTSWTPNGHFTKHI